MAYREAKTDKERKRGKSTDELSFKEALAFFKKRGNKKGSSKFRWKGDVYSTETGKKLSTSEKPSAGRTSGSSAPKTSKRPKARKELQGPRKPNVDTTDDARAARTNSSRSGPKAQTSTQSLSSPSADSSPSKPRGDSKPRTGRSRIANVRNTLSNVQAKRDRAREVLSERRKAEADRKAKQDNAPSFREYMNKKRRENPDDYREDPKGFTERMREMYKTTFGFNKGGMVHKGHTDRKKGMFYKSNSPRGYK